MKKFITCITLIAGTSLAHAANDVYGELAYSTFNYSETYSGTVYTASSGSAVRGIIGTEIDENLALEGMFATGMSSGSVTISGYNATIALDSMYGFYLKPKINLSDKASLFARIGYAHSNATLAISSLSYSSSASNSSISYGVGTNYKITDKMSLSADYMVYYNKDSVNVNGMAFGIGYKF